MVNLKIQYNNENKIFSLVTCQKEFGWDSLLSVKEREDRDKKARARRIMKNQRSAAFRRFIGGDSWTSQAERDELDKLEENRRNKKNRSTTSTSKPSSSSTPKSGSTTSTTPKSRKPIDSSTVGSAAIGGAVGGGLGYVTTLGMERRLKKKNPNLTDAEIKSKVKRAKIRRSALGAGIGTVSGVIMKDAVNAMKK